jgi:mRNA interferase YafQ
MYGVVKTIRFEKSFRKLLASGNFKTAARKDFQDAVIFLAGGIALPVSYADHQLHGEHQAYREFHIKGDLLLVYHRRDDQQKIVLIDIGTHSQLFG